MIIIRTIDELCKYCDSVKSEGKTLGLVPTMGALHAGHISLMRQAVKACDAVVASVFVNPVQFDNKDDLAKYPHTEEADCQKLEEAGVAAAFVPSVEEIYPPQQAPSTKVFDLGEVAEVMEGAHRPGHFQGVALIVSKLLRWVKPHKAFFGEKDFQQIAVIRRMVATEGIDTEIVACKIVREADGLALSSRNVRLTEKQRATAPGIFKALSESVDYSKTHTVAQTHDFVVARINSLQECEVEYFSIVDALTMQEASSWESNNGIQGCITVYCGKVRLIDNIAYRK